MWLGIPTRARNGEQLTFPTSGAVWTQVQPEGAVQPREVWYGSAFVGVDVCHQAADEGNKGTTRPKEQDCGPVKPRLHTDTYKENVYEIALAGSRKHTGLCVKCRVAGGVCSGLLLTGAC